MGDSKSAPRSGEEVTSLFQKVDWVLEAGSEMASPYFQAFGENYEEKIPKGTHLNLQGVCVPLGGFCIPIPDKTKPLVRVGRISQIWIKGRIKTFLGFWKGGMSNDYKKREKGSAFLVKLQNIATYVFSLYHALSNFNAFLNMGSLYLH